MSLATTTNYLTPTGREEPWRFTPLNRLAGLHDGAVPVRDRVSLNSVGLPYGVTVTIEDAVDVPSLSKTDDQIALRVREASTKVLLVSIAPHAELSATIFLNREVLDMSPEVSRVKINVGVNSHAMIVIENTGDAVIAEEIEINLEAGSNLRFVTLQEWSSRAVHVAKHHAIVAKDATFTSYVITIGGSLVRILPTVEYTGPGSSAELFGLYFATDGQHLEHRVHIEHGVPKAKSRVNYKGALNGDSAHTVWIGDVFIKAAAQGTDTYELNRNLLLSHGARADSVPNLEIETGDIVGAGHASTTGRFDDEQLFYLMSRGIPAEQARRLVIRGFFAEIVTKLNLQEIEERVMSRIDAELSVVKA
ncbi:MAG: Fe-S cluster assembly protein SufD [Actinomycetota bacterium]